MRNPWGRRVSQEREGSVWLPAVVGAINFGSAKQVMMHDNDG